MPGIIEPYMGDFLYGDFTDTLGIDDYYLKNLVSRQRGPNPAPSDSESRAIDSLANKLSTKIKSKNNENDTEEALSFDVKSAPRVILHEGKVLKRSHNSVLVTTSKRHMILFNDVLLITSVHSSGAFNTSEKYVIHQILSLDKCSIAVCNKEENPLVFEIQAPDKTYSFVCDREEDKRIWVEELTSAMLSIHYGTRYANYPGWPHEVIRGTLHSAAMMGDADMLSYHIQKCNADDSTVDLFDDQGMCPLHWAALRGHFECVRLLLTGGSDVDILNSGLNSALLMATSRGNDDVLRLLVDHGADLQLRNLKDRDALFMAVLYAHSSKGLPSILNTLNFQGVNLDQLDSTGAAPLHECAARNLPRPVQLLVDAGAAVNTKHGRSGITPLQVACSAKFPDAETVRSFLDKGAFPNWKDAENRSAFELALATHENHSARLTEEDDMSPIEYFVQSALPVLMEIVKKGGRYTEASISKLRPSFKEAIDTARVSWNQLKEPESFREYVTAKELFLTISPKWTSDSASGYCLLCVEKFTFSSRKHHCRSCGILCCATCSAKRLVLVPDSGRTKSTSSPSPNSPTSPTGGGVAERTCDGCFNKLSFEAIHWQQLQCKAKRDLEKLEAEEALLVRNVTPPPPPNSKASLFSGGTVDKNNNSTPTPNTSQTVNSLNDTKNALEKRGEMLNQVSKSGQQLNEGAASFSRMARQLKQQQEERNNWLGGKSSSSK